MHEIFFVGISMVLYDSEFCVLKNIYVKEVFPHPPPPHPSNIFSIFSWTLIKNFLSFSPWACFKYSFFWILLISAILTQNRLLFEILSEMDASLPMQKTLMDM
ncbi:hypothetical protein HMI56_002905 [Coelomomyces lativittatus]|nr:hypothetical protein HMI56_002905 [Coelomomyces lativittatus]